MHGLGGLLKLYYAPSKDGNFGDDMNLWFWDHFLPEWRHYYPDRTLFGIGTILSTGLLQRHSKVLVCGSGSGYGDLAPLDPNHVWISWVRGPLTARRLGLEDNIAISDPACLVTTLPEFANLPRGGKGTIFIPHRSTAQLQINWSRIGQLCDLQVVLPNQDSKDIIKKIIAADLVVTESMHGAIFADAFRIPWAPIRISNEFNKFKWDDWASGVGLTIDAPESLALPKKFWRFAGSLKSQLRRESLQKLVSPTTTGPVASTTHAKALQTSETGSFDLGEQGRQRVKKLLALVNPVIERVLASDIRRAMRHHAHLSAEGRIETLTEQMNERLDAAKDAIHKSLWY